MNRIIKRRGRVSELEILISKGFRYGGSRFNRNGAVHYLYLGTFPGDATIRKVRNSRIPDGFRDPAKIKQLIKERDDRERI